jgi:uncharacterized protein YdhG (YjbR/CyaY superfamily)
MNRSDAMAGTTKRARQAKSRETGAAGWTDEEIAAAKEHTKELKAAKSGKADGDADVRAKIAEMPKADRAIAERIHALIAAEAPELTPRTWYGMPAYANRDGKVVCFFTAAAKFKDRYASFGFNAAANLDDGTMWPTAWAITKLTAEHEARIAALVRKAVRP